MIFIRTIIDDLLNFIYAVKDFYRNTCRSQASPSYVEVSKAASAHVQYCTYLYSFNELYKQQLVNHWKNEKPMFV